MNCINLILGCHSHQPVGNFDFVFEESFEKSYRPFIEVLERFPDVRFTLHYTGPLWDWFLEHQPDYVKRIAALVERGQVEIMGGGYYEPLLCAIPERDARAQIHRMQAFCQEHFGARPKGMWLAERVWEPHMARILAESGVEYAALDDSHFLCSGLRPEALYGYYMTEEEGKAIKVFPIQEKMRYLVPFHQVQETIDYLGNLATEAGDRCVVLHDDGEKFGGWPGTYKSVYEEGWLERFFEALTEHKDWIRCVTYREYLDTYPPAGRTYITCASYQEMMGWALPTDRQRELKAVREQLESQPELEANCRPFLRGGFWRNFLAKYPEANSMQKRMLRVSRRVDRLAGHASEDAHERARVHLHRGQCNCAYWHGQFGGLYLNHLRSAVYGELLRADNALDAIDPPHAPVTVEMTDFDGDGEDECILSNAALGVFVSPHDGGTILELDFKPGAVNLLNTLARREEPYHDFLAVSSSEDDDENDRVRSIHEPFAPKEEGLHDLLFQDPWRRSSLRDHFYAADTTVESMYCNEAEELAALPGARYHATPESGGVTLQTQAPLAGEREGTLDVVKRIVLPGGDSALEITYDIKNTSGEPLSGIFAPEFAINLLTGGAPDRYYHTDERELARPMLGVRGMEADLRHFALRDEWQRLETGFRLEEPAGFYFYPLETISQSECGQERVHQGCAVCPGWPITLAPGETARRALTWYVRHLDVAGVG